MTLPVKINTSLPLIRDLKNTVPLEQTLAWAYAKTGLKVDNWPSKDPSFNEHQLLINHIKDNYRTLRVEEIKIAFEMALNGRLKVDTQHYQNFSCEYFSRIVNSYQEWKIPFSRQTKPKPQLTEQDQVKKNLELLLKLYLQWTGEYPFKDYHEWIFFRDLEYSGLELMTLEEKKQLFAKVKEELPKRLREPEDNWLIRVKMECQKRGFKQWITEQKQNNTNLEQLIKDKLK